jgi:hypothetical protein
METATTMPMFIHINHADLPGLQHSYPDARLQGDCEIQKLKQVPTLNVDGYSIKK